MGEWIEWKGGDCPVEEGQKVFVRFRSLHGTEEQPSIGSELRWSHGGWSGDIMAYKLADATLTNEGTKHDAVNAPSHYALLPGVQVIDVRAAIFSKMPEGLHYEVVDCWSRSWEYLTRMWGKNGLEDAKKARFYLDRMIEKMESTE